MSTATPNQIPAPRPPSLGSLISLMRLNKPVGIWLVFYPAAWAVVLASPAAPSPMLLLQMLVGAVLMRSAGCIINDIADRKFDREVARTRMRPLASGALSVRSALILLLVCLSASLALCFSLPHPRDALMLALGVLPLVALYPFMKRITWWPQLFLGLVFNSAVLFGWQQASGGGLPLEALILYAACAFWTLGYDTIYAVQDSADDARIGVKSTARRMGRHTHVLVLAAYALATALLALLMVRWQVGDRAVLAVIAFAVHTLWQWRSLRAAGEDAREHAGRWFSSNATLGLIVFVLLMSDRYSV